MSTGSSSPVLPGDSASAFGPTGAAGSQNAFGFDLSKCVMTPDQYLSLVGAVGLEETKAFVSYMEKQLSFLNRCVGMQFGAYSGRSGTGSSASGTASSTARSQNSGTASGSLKPRGCFGSRYNAIRKSASWRQGTVQSGMCYTKALRSGVDPSVVAVLGQWPAVATLLKQDAGSFQPLADLGRFRVVGDSAGLHVEAGGSAGVPLLDEFTSVSESIKCPRGSFGAVLKAACRQPLRSVLGSLPGTPVGGAVEAAGFVDARGFREAFRGAPLLERGMVSVDASPVSDLRGFLVRAMTFSPGLNGETYSLKFSSYDLGVSTFCLRGSDGVRVWDGSRWRDVKDGGVLLSANSVLSFKFAYDSSRVILSFIVGMGGSSLSRSRQSLVGISSRSVLTDVNCLSSDVQSVCAALRVRTFELVSGSASAGRFDSFYDSSSGVLSVLFSVSWCGENVLRDLASGLGCLVFNDVRASVVSSVVTLGPSFINSESTYSEAAESYARSQEAAYLGVFSSRQVGSGLESLLLALSAVLRVEVKVEYASSARLAGWLVCSGPSQSLFILDGFLREYGSSGSVTGGVVRRVIER